MEDVDSPMKKVKNGHFWDLQFLLFSVLGREKRKKEVRVGGFGKEKRGKKENGQRSEKGEPQIDPFSLTAAPDLPTPKSASLRGRGFIA